MKVTDDEVQKNYLFTFTGDTGYNALWDNLGGTLSTATHSSLITKLKSLYAPAFLEIA